MNIGLGAGGPALAQLRADQDDFKSVYKFAELAAAAYEGADKLRRKSERVTWVATPGHAHVQYFIMIDAANKTQIIAVRGTIDKVNWETKLDTLGGHDKRSGILMHRGNSA
ncbi:MAG: hypothetical protein HKN05_10105, partial [Rhizobiales bacterium]|nr:hypothetical protein [Hyphomicrobiales bacterium]